MRLSSLQSFVSFLFKALSSATSFGTRSRRGLGVVILAVALVASACGSSSSDTAGSTSGDAAEETSDVGDSDTGTEAGGDTSAEPDSARVDASSDDSAGDEAMEEEAMEEEAMEEEAISAEPTASSADADDAAADRADPISEEGLAEEIAPKPSPDPTIAPEPELPPEPEPRPQAGLLTAAEIDDNLNFAFFEGYLDRVADEYGQVLPRPSLDDRFTVTLAGADGLLVGNSPLELVDGQGRDARVFTNSAGQARIFADYLGLAGWATLDITTATGETLTVTRDGFTNGRDLVIDLGEGGGTTKAMDIAVVLDVTGSMGDELNYLTAEFESIIERLRSTYANADLRFSLVSYRDEGDDFVTRTYDFTDDAGEMGGFLAEQRADGGGDYPEALDAALEAANELQWRTGDVARVMIVSADAPPHDRDLARALDAARVATQKGIRIYPLAASGVGDTAEYLMRIMAATSGGRHLFLTNDSGIGGSHQEPKVQCYVVTNLADLLLRTLESELAGERIEANPASVLRSVGNYDRGTCTEQ